MVSGYRFVVSLVIAMVFISAFLATPWRAKDYSFSGVVVGVGVKGVITGYTGRHLFVTSDAVYVSGTVEVNGSWLGFIARFDKGLNSLEWYRVLNMSGSSFVNIYDVYVYGDYVYVAGEVDCTGFIAKLSSSGEVVWFRVFKYMLPNAHNDIAGTSIYVRGNYVYVGMGSAVGHFGGGLSGDGKYSSFIAKFHDKGDDVELV